MALIFLSNCDDLMCMQMALSSRIISSELIVFGGIKYCNSTYTANSVKMLAISLEIVGKKSHYLKQRNILMLK